MPRAPIFTSNHESFIDEKRLGCATGNPPSRKTLVLKIKTLAEISERHN